MITLASDFGSPYPAAMRGVIAQRTDARILDVAHDFPRQDVRAAAFWCREVLPWFPPAVHCVVVDPGVGTERDALVLRAGDHALVGPDNGVLLPAARELLARAGDEAGDDGDTDRLDAFVVDDADAASSTFHGRDVFAPTAARVHDAGVEDLAALPKLNPAGDWVDLRLPVPTVEADAVVGEVLVVDGFGNVITNVPGHVLDGCETVHVDGQEVPVGETFAAVPEGQWLATVGSHGNVELDVNHGRGDEAFGLSAGDRVELRFG